MATLIFGAGGIYIKNHFFGYEEKEFDYTKSDSIFVSAVNSNAESDSAKLADKSVDYEPELLDFSENEILPESDSSVNILINLNTADLSKLMTLPGVGKVTAKRIIELRERRKGFRSIDELMLVKGIGKSKLDGIRKYLIIE